MFTIIEWIFLKQLGGPNGPCLRPASVNDALRSTITICRLCVLLVKETDLELESRELWL